MAAVVKLFIIAAT